MGRLRMVCRMMVFCFFVSSCVNREDTKQTEAVDSIVIQDSVEIIVPVWKYDYEMDSVVRVGEAEERIWSVEELVDVVNNNYKNKVELRLVQRQEDTVYVRIDSAAYLTQQMGSAGARDFMSVATYTLTEAEGVEFVSFDFAEGDHASPGMYDRKFFFKK